MRRSSGARLAAAAFVLALSGQVALSGCGESGENGPSWSDLSLVEAAGTLPGGTLASGVRVENKDGELWLVAPIAREAWRPGDGAGRFFTGLPVLAVGHPRDGGPAYRLVADGKELAYEAELERFGKTPERFTTNAAHALRLELCLAPDAAPPETSEFWACLVYPERPDGHARVRGRRLSGAGFWVPSEHPRTLNLRLAPDARLSFATGVEPLFGARAERTAPQVFRVFLDGALLLEYRAEVDVLGESLVWHTLELPHGGVQRAELRFEVSGPLALTSILAPEIGPRESGAYGRRPFASARPDLVVFLADTFRADNLAAYGGTLGLTPELDRFAASARVFTQTWSTSTHTLPSHSSMFSGVYPPQNGQVDFDNPLPEALETIAERLSAAGYRCGLVSDGVMVSSDHGLDQGYGIFDERREAGTVERARAFLEADDGRPIFLFVQTYAVHAPYAQTEATRARLGERLKLDRSFADVMSTELMRSEARLPLGKEAPPSEPAAQEIATRLHDLYCAGVAELDELFARFRAELEGRGLLAHGALLFTSDHGESFFEHGRAFHTNWVYDAELRVPFVLQAPGVGAGTDPRHASLIDFAPTLGALAGLAPLEHWRGRSLLAPDVPRVLYAFQSRRAVQGSTFAVIDGTRKLIGYENLADVRAGKIHAAFDLARDPREIDSLTARETWPAELAKAQRAALEELLTPLVTPEHLQRTAEDLQKLHDLGYGGEEDEDAAKKPPATAPKAPPKQ